MAEKVILEVEVKSAKAGKDIKKVGDGAKASAKETTLLSGAMAIFKNGMIAARATSKILFGSIKAGLISTGIGAFVVIVGSLIGYLMNTKAGAEKLEQVLAGVGAIISVLTDRISMIGGAIAKVFSGDFAGAAADVKGALSGIGDEIIEEANAAMRLKKELQALKDATRDLSLEKAKATQEIEKAMLITVDETATNEEKLEALKRALKLEKEVTEQSLALQQRRVLAIEEEVALGESLEEDFQKLTDERIRLIELETASIKMQKKVATQVLAFERKIEADRTAIIKTASDARKKIREQEKKDAEKLAQETADSTLKMSTNTANTLTNLYYTTLESAKEVELLKLEAAREAADKLIDESKATDEAKFSASLALFTKFNVDSKNITDKYDNLEDAAEQASADRLLSLSQNLTIALTEDANVRAIQVIELARRTELASVDGMANSSALKKAINKKYNAQVQAQDKATSDAKRKFEAADIAAIGGMFGQAASMQTEGTEGWKKNKEAEARIGSIMGAMSAYNSFATIPIVGVPLGLAAAGLALAQGQKQIEEIRATEIPKMAKGGVVGGYGSGTSDSVNAKLSRGEVVINAKSAKMFRGALSNMNVAGGGVGFARGGATTAQETDISSATDFQNEPVKAFVITDDLTSSQDKLAQIRRRSRL
tara:strand:- start:1638 stop:3611 length:1974 start_codon:yes stop_codon:yes gene_type:complete